jgi:hypothetical protein
MGNALVNGVMAGKEIEETELLRLAPCIGITHSSYCGQSTIFLESLMGATAVHSLSL